MYLDEWSPPIPNRCVTKWGHATLKFVKSSCCKVSFLVPVPILLSQLIADLQVLEFSWKMSGIVRVQPSLQSIKSLPGDLRFVDSPTSDRLNINKKSRLGSSNMSTLRIPENGKLGVGVDEAVYSHGDDLDQANEDSPYSSNLASSEERPSIDEEDVDAVASSLPSSSKHHADKRWGDTSSYAAKKVYCCLFPIF